MFKTIANFFARLLTPGGRHGNARAGFELPAPRHDDWTEMEDFDGSHDRDLFRRSLVQWQLCHWEGLTRMERPAIECRPDRARLALLAAAGHLQGGDPAEGRRFLRLAREWGCSEKLVGRVLVAGVHNNLGRASALFDFPGRAREHFRHAATFKAMDKGAASLNDKYAVLDFIHQVIEPRFYLEIGVGEGRSLALARCDAVGVDPVPRDLASLGEKARVITAAGDEFFSSMAREIVSSPPDLALLDGMPLVDRTLQDFIHLERLAHPRTLVVVPGIHPRDPEQATRHRTGPLWTGDVWKLPEILETHRPDLQLLELDVEPSGLLLIKGLDPTSSILEQNTAVIQAAHLHSDPPPPGVIERADAVFLGSPYLVDFLESLKGKT